VRFVAGDYILNALFGGQILERTKQNWVKELNRIIAQVPFDAEHGGLSFLRKMIFAIFRCKNNFSCVIVSPPTLGRIATGTYFTVESGFFRDLIAFGGEGLGQPAEFLDAQARQCCELLFIFTNRFVFHMHVNGLQKSVAIIQILFLNS
jgi:hypothetical protein